MDPKILKRVQKELHSLVKIPWVTETQRIKNKMR